MHPSISEIGYHNRDYFLGQWDKFRDKPWGDLAHSTHLDGQGTWDPEHGEVNRVTVTLAAGTTISIRRLLILRRTRPIRIPSLSRTLVRCSTGRGGNGRLTCLGRGSTSHLKTANKCQKSLSDTF
jgi:hypothetical protein